MDRSRESRSRGEERGSISYEIFRDETTTPFYLLISAMTYVGHESFSSRLPLALYILLGILIIYGSMEEDAAPGCHPHFQPRSQHGINHATQGATEKPLCTQIPGEIPVKKAERGTRLFMAKRYTVRKLNEYE